MLLKKRSISDTFSNGFKIVSPCIDFKETILRINNISQLINKTNMMKWNHWCLKLLEIILWNFSDIILRI